MASTNQERLAITQRVRDGLKAEGTLGQSLTVSASKLGLPPHAVWPIPTSLPG